MIKKKVLNVAAIHLKNASMGSVGGSACLSLPLSTKYFVSNADAFSG